ncbi:DUF3231 family protein [Paenibacillus soyae]|uniref:DUF3231 family protein n=1 Tax=Paenibacillus soyae TaxID=2969249 RepID=A0A9X2SBB0_9BACL|nr:DUF3231 family protein [Paenibacillus soyae]MCR2805463.1 DUF3231 family protein [Paenibacillus soyae]
MAQRSDVVLNYKSVVNHAMQAGAMCYNLMVHNGWLEKQPEAIDRNALAGADRLPALSLIACT